MGKESKEAAGMKRLIRALIIRYMSKHENDMFEIKRKGGAEQVCKVLSKQSYEWIVKPALHKGKIYYTQEQLNKAVRETARAVYNCHEDSDCQACYLSIGKDDCVLRRLDKGE